MTFWDWYLVVVLLLFVTSIFVDSAKTSNTEEEDMSTVDETVTDMAAIADLIGKLPVTMQEAIASGTLSLSIDWEEVTRDEDDYPTIKPRVSFTPSKGAVPA